LTREFDLQIAEIQRQRDAEIEAKIREREAAGSGSGGALRSNPVARDWANLRRDEHQ
jgi:hypothetical protein